MNDLIKIELDSSNWIYLSIVPFIIMLSPVYFFIFKLNSEFRLFEHLLGIVIALILYIISFIIFYKPNSIPKIQVKIFVFIAVFLVSIYPLFRWFSLLGIIIPLFIIIFLFVVVKELDPTNHIHWKQILIFLGGFTGIIVTVMWLIETYYVFDFNYTLFSFQVLASWLGCLFIFIRPSYFPREYLLFDSKKQIFIFIKDHYLLTQKEEVSLRDINHIVLGFESRSRFFITKTMTLEFHKEITGEITSDPIKQLNIRLTSNLMIPSIFLQLVNIVKSLSLQLTVTEPTCLNLDDFHLKAKTSNKLSSIDFATYQVGQIIEKTIQEVSAKTSTLSSINEVSANTDDNISGWPIESNYQIKQLNESYFLKRIGIEKKSVLSTLLIIPLLFGAIVIAPPFFVFRLFYNPSANNNFEELKPLFPLLLIGFLLLILIFLVLTGWHIIRVLFGRTQLTFEGENLLYSFNVLGKQFNQRIIPKKLLIDVECNQNTIDLVFLGNNIINFWNGYNEDRLLVLEALKSLFS